MRVFISADDCEGKDICVPYASAEGKNVDITCGFAVVKYLVERYNKVFDNLIVDTIALFGWMVICLPVNNKFVVKKLCQRREENYSFEKCKYNSMIVHVFDI